MDEMIRRLPFHMRSLHCDTGSEFMNDHPVRFAKEHPKIMFARSRTGCCNDNAHLKQKNSSLVRTRFGYRRFDNPDLLDAINRLCVRWSDYNNLCVATSRDQEGLHSSLRQTGHTGRTCLGASRADGTPSKKLSGAECVRPMQSVSSTSYAGALPAYAASRKTTASHIRKTQKRPLRLRRIRPRGRCAPSGAPRSCLQTHTPPLTGRLHPPLLRRPANEE